MKNSTGIRSRQKAILGVLLCCVSLAGVSVPQRAQAAYPVIDFTAIARIAEQTRRQIENFQTQMGVYAEQMSQQITLFGQQAANDIKRSMMEVGQTTRVETEIFNGELITELQPVYPDACLAITVAEHRNETGVMSTNMASREVRRMTAERMPAPGDNPDPYASGVKSPRDWRLDMFETLSSGGGDGGEEYLDPSNLFIENMNDEQYRIAQVQTDLIVGAPDNEFVYRPVEGSENSSYQQEYVQKARVAMLKNAAATAIQNIISRRYAGNSVRDGVSDVGAVEEFLNHTSRDPEWIRRYTNTSRDINRMTTPAQVSRAMLNIEAMRLEVETMSFRELESLKLMNALSTLVELEN